MELEKFVKSFTLLKVTLRSKGEKIKTKLEETQDQINAILKCLWENRRKIFQEITEDSKMI